MRTAPCVGYAVRSRSRGGFTCGPPGIGGTGIRVQGLAQLTHARGIPVQGFVTQVGYPPMLVTRQNA